MHSRLAGRISHFLFIILSVIAIPFCLLSWFGEGHGASLSKLASIRPGMSQNQVLGILGSPSLDSHGTGFD